MFFIADIPPMTDIQVERLEHLVHEHTIAQHGLLTSTERTSLIFLKQANRFLFLYEHAEIEKVKENYKRLALINYMAFLKNAGK